MQHIQYIFIKSVKAFSQILSESSKQIRMTCNTTIHMETFSIMSHLLKSYTVRFKKLQRKTDEINFNPFQLT